MEKKSVVLQLVGGFRLRGIILNLLWNYGQNMNDRLYLRLLYRILCKRKLNLNNPKRYSEKAQWLKLYDRRPEYSQLVDKYDVKSYVSERIGSEHVVPAFGVWNSFDEIDFDTLPNQFVLKCTHDSGSFYICEDKNSFDRLAARTKLERGLSKNFFYQSREWPYLNVKPRILAERYIDSLGKKTSIEYKLTCINGVVKVITVCGGIAHSAYELRSNDNFSCNWERQNWYVAYKPTHKQIEKPKEMDDMIKFSEKLSSGIPYLRVDWYVVDGVIYFGEMTFYTWGGFCQFVPDEWDFKMGEWLQLPKVI